MRSLQGKCLGEISDSRREKEKEKQEAKRAVTNKVASNPFEKVAPAGRPTWPTNIRTPTTRHIGEKAKERKGRKENRNSSIPMMETKAIHPMTVPKEKADIPPSTELHTGWTDQDWDPSVNQAGTHPMTSSNCIP